MPNYGLVVTPTYDPMSYADYAKPFEDYAKAYEAMAGAYDALEMEANQWEKLAGSDKDAPQYQQYKNYANDIRALASELATKGLSQKTRGDVSTMRQRYAGEIKPIEDAFNYRQKMAEEQRKLNPNGTKIFDVDYSNVGLGYIMQNPNAGYRQVDLPLVTKEVADVMSNYKQVLMNSGQWGKTNVSGLLERIETYGLQPEDIAVILYGEGSKQDNDLYKQIRDVVNRAYNDTGVESWGDNSKSEAVYNAALQGVYYGLGTGKVKDTEDPWMPYYIWRRQQKDVEDKIPEEKLWDFLGTDVDVAENTDLEDQKKKLDILTKIVESGQVPSETITREGYSDPVAQANYDAMVQYEKEQLAANPNWNKNTDKKYKDLEYAFNAYQVGNGNTYYKYTVKNPDYKVYKELSDFYKTTNLVELRDAFKADYENNVKSAVTINKYTKLNSATNERTVTKWLADEITSGNDDKELKRLVKIEKNGKVKDMSNSDVENLKKALADSDSSFQVNFNNGKFRVHHTEHGDFYIDLTVLHNLRVPFLNTLVPADDYVKTVVELNNAGKITDESLKNYINNFYAAIVTNTRLIHQEPGKTNSQNQM